MSECNGTVVRIIFTYQNVAVEPAHLRYGKHTDRAKALRVNRKHLPLSHIGAESGIRRTLKTEEGDIRWRQIALQRSEGVFFREGSGHDFLISHIGFF